LFVSMHFAGFAWEVLELAGNADTANRRWRLP
jgi:hypothetical protein